MSDIEKVICCHDRNDGNNDSWLPMAMMNGGMNNWMNNPFAYMMMMAWTEQFGRNRNGNWGQNAQNIELQNQIQAMRTQMQDNQNSNLLNKAIGDGFTRNDFALSQLAQNLGVDFNSLKDCCCQVQAAIRNVAGRLDFSAERVINAANSGDCRIIEALKDCCCQNKELVQRMGYETQLGLKDVNFNTERGFCNLSRDVQNGFEFVNRSVERGFAASDYATQKQTCDIINAGNANTQRIMDLLNGHWSDEKSLQIQDLKFQNSQLKQNEYFANLVRGGNCGCHRNNCCQENNCGGCGCGY